MAARADVGMKNQSELRHRTGMRQGAAEPEGMSENFFLKAEGHMSLTPEVWNKETEYILDVTKSYRNLLQKEEQDGVQSYIWDHEAVFLKENGEHYSYLNDMQGSAMSVVDHRGACVAAYAYDEFGTDLYGNQGQFQPFGYTGYQKDAVAGTYYAQAREYDAWAGRFVSEDVIKGNVAYPKTLNAYGYCWGNPVKFVDRDGAWPKLLENIGSGIQKAAEKTAEWVDDHSAEIITGVAVVASVAVVAACVVTAPVTGGVLAGAAIGCAVGAGTEIHSQIQSEGKVTDVKKVIISSAMGTASGALTGGTASLGVSMAGNAAISVGGSVATDYIDYKKGQDISMRTVALHAVISGVTGTAAGFLGGEGAQYHRYLTTYTTNIFFNGRTIESIMKTAVWKELGKYGTVVIEKELLKGFVNGTIPSFLYAIYETISAYLKKGLENEECTE